uniref:F-box domain-containing protein n=1 Tax=Periophthalmus magnuspinnatus TaxID=409849 RepID=A0A3B4AU09_9GOBI
LPYEILLKIVSYLDATSLYYLSRVNKQFCHLANDDLLWHKIYMTRFGVTRPWWMDYPKPRVIPGHSSTGFWKQKYFKALVEQDNPINVPFCFCRNLNVTWHLRVQDYYGQEVTLEPSKVYFFETSIIVRWSNERLPFFNQISRLELHGLKKETHPDRKPQWHSLMLRQDRMDHPKMIGKDRLIKVLFISPGFIVGILRGQKVIVFIMVCLHFHKLVERSLFGSPVRYVQTDYKWFGSLGPLVIWHPLLVNLVYMLCNAFRYITLPLLIFLLDLVCDVQNCCIMTLTLLDEFQKPFWCVSAPITITRSKRPLSFNYSGDHFFMNFHHPEGQVKMKLVWLHEEKQFFLIDLTLLVTIHKVNKYFCTNY